MHARRLVDENDGHDDAIDGDRLAENNGNQVFGADARRLDRGAEQRGAGQQNAPVFVFVCVCVFLEDRVGGWVGGWEEWKR